MTITNYLGVGQKGCKLEGAHLGASGDLTVLCDLGCDLYRYLLCIYVAATAKSLQSCLTLCDPIDGSPRGTPVLGFSRQEHWSGLPFPSPMHESEK